jgi:hypothetical protein
LGSSAIAFPCDRLLPLVLVRQAIVMSAPLPPSPHSAAATELDAESGDTTTDDDVLVVTEAPPAPLPPDDDDVVSVASSSPPPALAPAPVPIPGDYPAGSNLHLHISMPHLQARVAQCAGVVDGSGAPRIRWLLPGAADMDPTIAH